MGRRQAFAGSNVVETVEKTGGHLASSLGVVELTLALLKVFSPPKDAIVWDVGHQSYPYKILTGRKDRFHTLRQLGGISGFPSIKESPYDAFGTGHSSTSISAALGIKVARRLKGKEGKVIAVIGDGALTAGEAYEGLNNAGQLGEDLIVILNDNEMSISKNIGAISNYLTKVTTGETVRKTKERLEELQLDKGKMKVLMEQIRNWVRENPTSTAQLLEVWLEEGSTGGE
jgi:1-deoxy-D-xylulose-5-phosphate synthase